MVQLSGELKYIACCELCGESDFCEVGRWNFRIVVCKKCGLVFMNPVDWNHLKDLYNRRYDYRHFRYNVSSRDSPWDFERVDWVHRYCRSDSSKPRRLLEIGCGTGSLLELFRNRGWEVEGIEPGIKAARFAVEKRELKIGKHFWNEAQVPPGYFDMVLLVSTLEHMPHPVSALEKIHKALKLDGLLFLEVPNVFHERGFYIDFTWRGYRPTPQHLYVYSPKTIRLLLAKVGFSLLEISTFREQLKVVARKENERCRIEHFSRSQADDYRNVISVLRSNERTLRMKWPFHITLRACERLFAHLLPNFLLFRFRACKRFLTPVKQVKKND